MSESDECPLCMEVMEIDDLNFFPCSCGYQICRFCWHRIKTDENGLCPACRKAYSEDPAMYQPLSKDEIQKIKKERKQREAQRKQKISESRKHLSNVRVIQKNLLFVVGLSQRLADVELLKKHEYFGKYGKILKVIINPSTNYAGPQGPSASAYITYSKEEENLKAILAVNNIQQDGRTLRVSLGTTKYCTHFLRNMQCKNPDCMYLHEMGDDNACFTKEDMQQGKHQAYERELLDNFQMSLEQRRKSQEIENELQQQQQLHQQQPQQQQPQVQQKEDWNEEINDGQHNSALPPRAAWAEKEAERDTIEGRKESLEEQAICSSWSTTNELKDYVDSRQEKERCEDSISPFQHSTSPLAGSLPKEILHPNFATGWATSEEIESLNHVGPTMQDDRTDQSYLSAFWPVHDLGLKNLQVSNDDDLGFDPFEESNKGLSDIFAIETESGANQNAKPNVGQNSWPNIPGGNDNYFARMNKDISQQYSLFGDTSQGSNPSSFFGSYFNTPSNPVNAEKPLTSSEGMYTPMPSARQYAEQPQKNQYKSNGPDLLAWQDGLRALLPNVNISFSAKRPPPGFDSSTSPIEESIWTKINKNEKRKETPPAHQQDGFSARIASIKPSNSSNTLPEQSMQPLTPWTAVVGRAQGNAIPVHADGSNASLTHQGAEGKPAVKPLTSFVSGNSQRSQKPTAKVKPQMKCISSPSQEMPPNILQRSNSRGINLSRMNDLDEISLSDPLPVNRNVNAANPGNSARDASGSTKDGAGIEAAFPTETAKKPSKKKKKSKEKQELRKVDKRLSSAGDGSKGYDKESNSKGRQDSQKGRKGNEKPKDERMKEPIKIQQRPKQPEILRNELKQGRSQPSSNVRPDPPKIRILKTDTPNTSAITTMTQSSPMESVSKGYPGHEVFNQLAETTEKLLQNVLSETEVIKSNTEQISKDLKNALEKRKDPSLSVADLEKINYLLSSPMAKGKEANGTHGKESESTFSVADWEKLSYLLSSSMANGHLEGKQPKNLIDTLDLERQVDLARKEAKLLEVRLNDVIRKNMASEVENANQSDGGKGH